MNFLNDVKREKIALIKKGKIGNDLISILCSEGADIYGLEKDDKWLPKMLLDDISVVYVAAVATTQISVNNIMKYVHMD